MSAQRYTQFFDLDSETEEDDRDSFSWDGMRDENDGDDNGEDVVDDDVSESESSIYTSSDEEPTAEDLAFIVPDTYESSGEDTDSDDGIDEEEGAHVGHIEGDGTFIPLAGYEDLMLRPSLKLRILRKHTVERPACCLRLDLSGQDSISPVTSFLPLH
jgi:hypothetical protein